MRPIMNCGKPEPVSRLHILPKVIDEQGGTGLGPGESKPFLEKIIMGLPDCNLK